MKPTRKVSAKDLLGIARSEWAKLKEVEDSLAEE